MNTRIEYMYRDARNYKFWQEVTVEGELSEEDISEFCDAGQFFDPVVVGLPPVEIPHDYKAEIDHPWHELQTVSHAESPVTEKVTANELLNRFEEAASTNWNGQLVD